MRIVKETLAHQGHIRYFKHSRSTRYWRVLTGSSARENSPSLLEHNNVTCLVESDGLPGAGQVTKDGEPGSKRPRQSATSSTGPPMAQK
jgi:hypothetical protein